MRQVENMSKLKSGDKAPQFTLLDQHENKVKLTDFKGRKVLLFFYPKASTSGCTKQSCQVSEALPQLKKQKIAALGISPDAPAKQLKFDDKYSLGFPLLSDADHKVAVKYGAWGKKKLYGREYEGIIRSAFVIDEKGKIEAVRYKVKPLDTVKLLDETTE